jgi:Putative peptidoglycan binding domain
LHFAPGTPSLRQKETGMKFCKVTDHASVDGNPEPIGYTAAVAEGVGIAGIRRSYTYWDPGHGAWATLTDYCFARDAPVARAAGAAVLGYYAPSFYKGSPAPEDLASVAWNAGAHLIRGKDFPLCVDVEWGPQGFDALGLTQTQVIDLILRHVAALRILQGCAPIIYTSYNELYDLGLPALPELADVWLWIKTAYPVSAGQPPYEGTIAQPHSGEVGWDPRDYYRIPQPWTSYLLQQTQGDAHWFPGFRQCDLGRAPIYQLGDSGAGVVRLQQQMIRAGAKISVDGDFGPITEQALQTRQQDAQLVPTGKADPRTIAAISWY